MYNNTKFDSLFHKPHAPRVKHSSLKQETTTYTEIKDTKPKEKRKKNKNVCLLCQLFLFRPYSKWKISGSNCCVAGDFTVYFMDKHSPRRFLFIYLYRPEQKNYSHFASYFLSGNSANSLKNFRFFLEFLEIFKFYLKAFPRISWKIFS